MPASIERDTNAPETRNLPARSPALPISQADEARRQLCPHHASDHLALVAAFEGWLAARTAGNEAAFCDTYFLSFSAMANIARVREHLVRALRHVRLRRLRPPATGLDLQRV